MGVMDFLRGRTATAPAPAVRDHEPAVMASGSPFQSEGQWSTTSSYGRLSRAGVRVDEETVLTLPATLQALRVLCGVYAMAPLVYFQKTTAGRVHATSEPIYDLLHTRPNQHQDSFQFAEMIKGDQLLHGNFYAYISRDFAGRPVALTRIKPSAVVVSRYFDRASGVMLFYDLVFPDGTSERLTSRDVFHVVGAFSLDGYVGINPLRYLRDTVGGAIATSDHAAKFWGNSGKPDVALKVKGKISADDKARMRNDYAAIYSGPLGASIGVFDQEMDVAFLAPDNQKSQMIETRQFQVVDLARVWGVPPHLIFDLSRSTNNNIEHQSLEFLMYHLGPSFRRVSGAATRTFGAPGFYFEHETDSLVRTDLKSRREAQKMERDMGMVNANELRARDNQSSIPGAAGTDYWRPANMMISGADAAPAPPAE